MSARPDVVVVGGGVIGLAVAYELARSGMAPWILDRGRRGGEASRAAAGMLAPVSEIEQEAEPLVAFGLASLAAYPDFVTGLERLTGASCGFRREGTLWVARHQDDARELEHLGARLLRRGLAAEPLTAAEVLELEPHLSGRVVGGLRVGSDLQIDPRSLVAALENAVVQLEGTVRRDTAVEAIESIGPGRLVVRYRVADRPLEVECARAVVAAGAWSTHGLRLPGGILSLRPVKGQLVRLRGTPLLRHVIRNPECYLVPRADGELLIGATMEEQGFDIAPGAGAILDLLRHAFALVPGIYDLDLAEVSVGLRPATPDHLPVIGACEVEGLYFATGHFRNGVLLAPATARALANLITTGAPPPELAPFAPARLVAS